MVLDGDLVIKLEIDIELLESNIGLNNYSGDNIEVSFYWPLKVSLIVLGGSICIQNMVKTLNSPVSPVLSSLNCV